MSFYRLISRHLDRYVGMYEERFEPRYGPLRGVVVRTGEAYLECGRLQNGFAREGDGVSRIDLRGETAGRDLWARLRLLLAEDPREGRVVVP